MFLGAGDYAGAMAVVTIEMPDGGRGDLLHDLSVTIRATELPAGSGNRHLIMSGIGFLPECDSVHAAIVIDRFGACALDDSIARRVRNFLLFSFRAAAEHGRESHENECRK